MIAVMRCSRCWEPLSDDAPAVDLYGGPVCSLCHREELSFVGPYSERTCQDCGQPIRLGWLCGACLDNRFGGDAA